MYYIVEKLTKTSGKNTEKSSYQHQRNAGAWRKLNRILGRRSKKKRKQRRAKTTAAITSLRDKIFPHIHGQKFGDAVYPSLNKESFINSYNEYGFARKLPNYKILDHFQNETTCYYWSSPNKTALYALIMIDIDAGAKHGGGTTTGAESFAKHLQTIWSDMYFEKSTNGEGQHGYLLLDKDGYYAEDVKACAKHLERFLRSRAIGFDIKCVEIKGLPPVVKYQDGRIQWIKCGCFAKLPREAHRFEEWQKTTRLTVAEVYALQIEPVADNKEIESKKAQITLSGQNIAELGSISGKNISKEEIELMPTWERFFRQHVSEIGAGRWKVAETDFAQAICLLRFFKENPNADGSLPGKRAAALWKALYECGDFSRPWNHHRWKAIRDWMSANGWIDWVDNRYEPGTGRSDGIACRWGLSGSAIELLESLVSNCTFRDCLIVLH